MERQPVYVRQVLDTTYWITVPRFFVRAAVQATLLLPILVALILLDVLMGRVF